LDGIADASEGNDGLASQDRVVHQVLQPERDVPEFCLTVARPESKECDEIKLGFRKSLLKFDK
jgi:hypothetical protein